MAFSSFPEKWSIKKNLFRFVRRNAMAEFQMKGVALVPFKIGYPHAPPLFSVIHSMTKVFVKIKGFLSAAEFPIRKNYMVSTTIIHGISTSIG
jgi:hypothetical protein